MKSKGFVLRENDYKENDRILTVLTEDYGKLSMKARGVRKSSGTLKTACQLLTFSEFTFIERNGFHTITEAVPIQQFPDLRNSLEDFCLASYIAQITEQCTMEGELSKEFLSLALNAVYALSVLKKPHAIVKSGFEFRIACELGYAPDISYCAGCGAEHPDKFLLHSGVLLCSECACNITDEIRFPMTDSLRSALLYLGTCPPNRLYAFTMPKEELSKLSSLTETYLITQLEQSFSTLDFYKKVMLDTMTERSNLL